MKEGSLLPQMSVVLYRVYGMSNSAYIPLTWDESVVSTCWFLTPPLLVNTAPSDRFYSWPPCLRSQPPSFPLASQGPAWHSGVRCQLWLIRRHMHSLTIYTHNMASDAECVAHCCSRTHTYEHSSLYNSTAADTIHTTLTYYQMTLRGLSGTHDLFSNFPSAEWPKSVTRTAYKKVHSDPYSV